MLWCPEDRRTVLGQAHVGPLEASDHQQRGEAVGSGLAGPTCRDGNGHRREACDGHESTPATPLAAKSLRRPAMLVLPLISRLLRATP